MGRFRDSNEIVAVSDNNSRPGSPGGQDHRRDRREQAEAVERRPISSG